MNDEQRLQAITEQLIIVRDNLFRGMSKSMQKLQAKSINEVLELPNFTESPQRKWVGLTDEQIVPMFIQRQKQQTEGEKDEWYFYAWGVSDGEAAHGIKE